jgi:dephospho-CoA kinase
VGGLGVGKDTIAEILKDSHVKIAYADKVKDVCKMLREGNISKAYIEMCFLFNLRVPKDMFLTLCKFADYPFEESKDRKLLQDFATNWARRHDPDVWVRSLKGQLKPDIRYIITDARFENEIDAFPDFLKIYVTADFEVRKQRIISRDGNWDDKWLEHESEKRVELFKPKCDIIIDNSGTIDALRDKIMEALNK